MSRKKNKRKRKKLPSGKKRSIKRKIPFNKLLFDMDAELKKAVQYHQSGQLQKAEEIYKKILEINPNHSDTLHLSGVIAHQEGEDDAAAELINKAIKNNPKIPIYYNDLGAVLRHQGKLNEAISCYQEALQLTSDLPEAYNNMGNALRDQGKLNEAISFYRKALRLRPDDPETYNNMGNAFKDQGKLNEAISCYQQALQFKPDCFEAYNNMCNPLQDQGRIDEATECYQKALRLKPDSPSLHSSFVFNLNYHDKIDPVHLFSQHRQWAEQHASPFYGNVQPYLNDNSSDRCLRVGYVSPDFRAHSVAYFIESVIASHDRTAFEIFCYSDVARPDSLSRRLKVLADCWRDIFGMSDDQVAELIRKDKIDIFVDLAGYTNDNRLLVFARKPAAVQVTYLGYPNTTGLETMDYRVTDSWADPPDQTEYLHTEKLVRLPHGFLCYKPHDATPAVTDLPALKTGHITFGSFNHRPKITREVVRLWSEILDSVANSKLVLKSRSLSDEGTQRLLQEMFAQNGVSPDRIRIIGHISSPFKHLELYNSIDIGLDTFPYNGTTTTCEAMWMGVPVIVLAGRTHISRVGVSLLSNMGLPELIAKSTEDYVEKAIQLSKDMNRLKVLRASLRSMMAQSPLMDAQGFTRSLEEAYRQMWQQWCKNSRDYFAGSKRQRKHTSVALSDARKNAGSEIKAGPEETQREKTFVEGCQRDSNYRQTGRDQQQIEPPLIVRMKGDIEVCVPNSIELLTPYVLLEQEDWFESEIEFVRHMLRPGMQVIDIGANYGLYTLTMAKAVDSKGKVWAFEPTSTTAGYLRKSIRRNKMANVKLIQAGLSSHRGKAELSLNPNSELNELVRQPEICDACETIQLFSLDDCLQKFAWRDIAFVKLDAEGEENNIIQGGSRFLLSHSPLIMFELKHGEKLNLGLIDRFSKCSYKTYRLIPGLNLLVPFDPSETLDPYQLNLFCCKKDRASLLEAQGLLVNNTSEALPWSAPDEDLWVRFLSDSPYTRKVLQQWLTTSHNRPVSGWKDYKESLNYYFCAHFEMATPVDRYACLQKSLSILSVLLDTHANFSRLQTLARVTWEMGKRQIAIKALDLLVDMFLHEQQVDLREPFLAVTNRFEVLDTGDNVAAWCLSSILEQRAKLQAFSSYYTGKASLATLEKLKSYGFQGAEMERRRQLIRMRCGMQDGPQFSPVLSLKTKDNLNPKFWGGHDFSFDNISKN